VLLAWAGNVSGINPPAGWALITTIGFGELFFLVAGPSEPATYTFTLTGAPGFGAAGIIVDYGASLPNLLTGPATASGAGTSFTAPSTTAIGPDTIVEFFFQINNTGAAISLSANPNNATVRGAGGGGVPSPASVLVDDFTYLTGGTTPGGDTASTGVSNTWDVLTIALALPR